MGELIWDPNGAYLLFRSANRFQMGTVRGVPPPCPTDLRGGTEYRSGVRARFVHAIVYTPSVWPGMSQPCCHGSPNLQAHLHAALVLQGLRLDAIRGGARARRGGRIAGERCELARELGDGGVVVGPRGDGRLHTTVCSAWSAASRDS